ncbi:MAG: efflux RND transporter periplasmic adaptor subunit [Alphaproteobacteria bacterium]|nr:efflux RND transporter periplasmic adaptor subunit [Alphaproteobacteria bacterium]
MNKPADQSTLGDAEVAKTLGLGKGRRRRRWLLWVVALLAILGVAAYFVSSGLHRTLDRSAFETAEIRRGSLSLVVAATGEIKPINQVEVGAEISGLIAEIFVDYDDRVTRGQELARLDTSQLSARVLQARANLAQAKAGVLQAEATVKESEAAYKRTATLAERSIASTQELDARDAALARARAGVESAKATVQVAEAELAVAESNLDKATIRSPIDGTVLDRRVEVGQTVAASLQTPVLFVLAEDLSRMELHVGIDEADIGRVNVGQEAKFTVDAYPDRTFEARVREVRNAPQRVNNVVTYPGILSVPNEELLLKPGMTADTDIVTRVIENALRVPNSALRFTPPGQKFEPLPPAEGGAKLGRVWVWRGGPKPVTVTMGESDGSYTEVLDGKIAVGDVVLTNLASGDAGRKLSLSIGPPRR